MGARPSRRRRLIGRVLGGPPGGLAAIYQAGKRRREHVHTE